MKNYYIYMNDKKCQRTRIKRENLKDTLEEFTSEYTDFELSIFEITCWKGSMELQSFQECIEKIISCGGEVKKQREGDMYTQIHVRKDKYLEILKLKQEYNLPSMINFNINFNFKTYDYEDIPEPVNVYRKHNSIWVFVDSEKNSRIHFDILFPFELRNQSGISELIKIERILKIKFLPKRFFEFMYNEKLKKYKSKNINLTTASTSRA